MSRFTAALLSISALILTVGPSPVVAQDAEVLDEIVAVVGNYIVLKSDVDGFVLGVMNQQQIPYTEDLWDNALDQLINEKVLVIHARRDTNLVVTDQQVDQMLDQRISEMSARVGSESRLEDLYGRSVIEIKADLREEFRDQLLADQMRNTKLRTIKATPSDVEEWFSQFPTDSLPTLPDIVQVSHIVVKPLVTQEARDETMEIISAIRDSVIAGRNTIEEMARAFSEDPGSADNGGLYEGTRLAELVPEFAAVASRIPLDTFSQIFETRFGLHFLRVNARRGDVIDYNHILIGFDDRKTDPTQAIEKLTAYRDSILTGKATFESVAREHSEEDLSSIRGGRVVDPSSGERNLYLENLGPLWQQTLSTMEVGEVSPPSQVALLDGKRAFHTVRLDKRVASHRVDIETDYDLVEQLALRDKQSMIMSKWLNTLRSDVFVDLRGRARNSRITSK